MIAAEVKKGIYWVGAIDWSLRSFHGYTTQRGSTYNAYLILDDKITLVDTVKEPFAQEMLERIRSVVDPANIDYLVSNHVEMDHSGSIPAVMKAAPHAKIVTSAPQGVKGLTAHYGAYDYLPVKLGDSVSLGGRTLRFIPTPMLHWPDNMVTYCEQEKLLFSNDAFGQHYASSGRFDDEEPYEDVMREARKYYANIVMPYAAQVKRAYQAVSGLEIDTIAPSHGVIWRKYIPEILACYADWCRNEPDESAAVVYDTMWRSTEKMAKTIAEAFAEHGIKTKLYDLKANDNSDIMTDLLTTKYIAVGSPTLNNNMMPTVASFLTYLRGLAPQNRKAFAFGSYGWGGQSIAQVEEQLKACGFEILFDGIRQQYVPTQEQLGAITKQIHAIV